MGNICSDTAENTLGASSYNSRSEREKHRGLIAYLSDEEDLPDTFQYQVRS
jgi:hypothetical protein